jgi:dinuclear metal center YbgI/SA1388 family protein
MILSTITEFLESKAPPSLQENYDNSGLIVGSPDMEITSATICLDSTPEVVRDAIESGSNLIIAHHPIVFSGLKKFNGKNYVERTVIEAIRNNVAIYAIHTNLDNVQLGVNKKIADKLSLNHQQILEKKPGVMNKLAVFVPVSHAEMVRSAMFSSGAGSIGNYDECSFNSRGEGTFRAGQGTSPFVGTPGERHTEEEVKIEVLVPTWSSNTVLKAMKAAHPYEEVAYDVYPIGNQINEIGSGMIGELAKPIFPLEFLDSVKRIFGAGCIRYTKICKEKISRVAVCGGSGSFLLPAAIRAGADVLLTSDFKYHQFFDAEDKLIIADIGHFEGEQFTMELLSAWLAEKFPTFATRLTRVNTNPLNYL